MKKSNSQLVYSTHVTESDQTDNTPSQNMSTPSGTAYIERDRKKRRGKVVTVVSRLDVDLKSLQKELQKECGAGGSVKNNTIEIQGDHRDKIAGILKSKGFKVKFIGG